MTWEDPIVEQVRKDREKLLEEHRGLENFLDYIQKRQQKRMEHLMAREKEDTVYRNIQNR